MSGGTLPARFLVQLRDGGGFAVGGLSSSSNCVDAQTSTHTHALQCHPNETFSDIKGRLWAKVATAVPSARATDYLFRLTTGELIFEDDDLFSRFLAIHEIFREGPHAPAAAAAAAQGAGSNGANGHAVAPMLECLLVHRDHVADRYTRESRPLPALTGLLVHRGVVHSRSEGLLGASWKARYGVIQDMVFYSFDSEETYARRDMSQGGGSGVECMLLGAVIATKVDTSPAEKEKGYGAAFIISKAAPPASAGGPGASPLSPGVTSPNVISPPLSSGSSSKSSSAGAGAPVMFYCDTDASAAVWIDVINRLHLRRVKSICLALAEELDSRGLDSGSMDGLFRLSGNKKHVEELQDEFDRAKSPNLGLVLDEHVLAGVLKTNLRNMPNPLVVFEAYGDMMRWAQSWPPSRREVGNLEQRLGELQAVVQKLPQSNQGLLEFLMTFLSRLADHSDSNRMTPANLAICFAPNILRPRTENVAGIMADSKNVLQVVEQLITHARTLWPNYNNTRRTSRLAVFKAGGAKTKATEAAAAAPGGAKSSPSGSRSPQPPSLQTVSETTGANPPRVAGRSPSPPHLASPTVPPPGRSGAGPSPPPPRTAAAPTATSAASASISSSPPRVPYIPVGGVQMMVRKDGPPPPPPPPMPAASSVPASPTMSPTMPPTVPELPAGAAAAVAAARRASLSRVNPSSSVAQRSAPSTPAVPSLPEELLSLSEQSRTLGEQWVSSLAASQRSMAASMAQMQQSHTAALKQGSMTAEESASTALTVQQCMHVLAADMSRFEREYAKLIRFVQEQSAPGSASTTSPSSWLPSPSSPQSHRGRMSSATKPTRQAAAAPVQAHQQRVWPPPAAAAAARTHATASGGPQPPPGRARQGSATSGASSLSSSPSQPSGLSSPPPPRAAAARPARSQVGDIVCALYPYAGGSDSMSLAVGDRLLLLEGDEQEEAGPDGVAPLAEWWLGRRLSDEQEGYFPATFVGPAGD